MFFRLFGVLVPYLMGFQLLPRTMLPPLLLLLPYFPHLLLFLLPSWLFPPEGSCNMPPKEADSIMVTGCHGNTQILRTLVLLE